MTLGNYVNGKLQEMESYREATGKNDLVEIHLVSSGRNSIKLV